MKKRTIAVLLTMAMAATMMAGCGSKSDSKTADGEKSYTIGISQFAEHGSLDNCREGFLEGLKEEGIEEGKNLNVEYKNSAADMGTASQIASSFVSDKVDLICGIAELFFELFNAGVQHGDVAVCGIDLLLDGINLFGEQGKVFGFIGLLRLQRGDFVFEVGLFVGELGLLGFHIGYGIVGVAERCGTEQQGGKHGCSDALHVFRKQLQRKNFLSAINFDFIKGHTNPFLYTGLFYMITSNF